MDRAFLTGDPAAGELILVRHGQQQFPEPGTKDFSKWVDPPALQDRPPPGRGDRDGTCPCGPSPRSTRPASERAQVDGPGHRRAPRARRGGRRPAAGDRDVPRLADRCNNPAEAFGAEAMPRPRRTSSRTRRWAAIPGTETGDELRGSGRRRDRRHPRRPPGRGRRRRLPRRGDQRLPGHRSSGSTEDMFFRPAHASVHRVAFQRRSPGDRRAQRRQPPRAGRRAADLVTRGAPRASARRVRRDVRPSRAPRVCPSRAPRRIGMAVIGAVSGPRTANGARVGRSGRSAPLSKPSSNEEGPAPTGRPSRKHASVDTKNAAG